MLSEGRLTLFSPAVFKFMHLSVKAAYVEIIFPFLYTLVSRQHTDFLTVTFNGLIFLQWICSFQSCARLQENLR